MDHTSIFLRKFLYDEGIDPDLRRLIHTVSVASKYISALLMAANRKSSNTRNASAEDQLEVDKRSDIILYDMITALDYVGEYASEEQEKAIQTGHPKGKFSVSVDPLDGSSLIDVNLAVGTIVGIHDCKKLIDSGRHMLAAIYILYGPLTTLVYTSGKGVHEFVLSPEGEFVLTQRDIRMKDKGSIYSPGGLRTDWTDAHRQYIDDLVMTDYKLRYSGGLVPDFNQIIMKGGGLFSYPGLKDKPEGKLRLLFELYPLAFLCEQAGGLATNGLENILDIKLEKIHQRAPIYIGSKNEVEKAKAYLK
ncbi:MAG: class 1 fructose-bisphosphatase [Candidatus Sericytochromatia bacterium]